MTRLHITKILQRFIYDSLAIKRSTCSVMGLAALLWLLALLLCWLLLGDSPCPTHAHCSDNLLGRPLPGRACLDQPIDAVYTWVNGSDPEFQRELRAIEWQLRRPAAAGWRQRCWLPDCVPAARLSVVPPLPRRLALSDVRFFIPGAAPQEMLPSPLRELAATELRFASVDEARRALQRGAEFHINEDNYTLFQTFWTSDETAPLTVAAPDHVLLMGAAEALAAAPAWGDAAEVARRDDNRAIVVRLPDESAADRLVTRGNLTVAGEPVTVARARLALRLLEPPGDAVAPSRFADSQELRYSLRSLERHAPWVRHVYLVTNGQIPDWLALDSTRLTLVTHEEIFPDTSHLPTFSSPAIEAHLHRIRGLSERFLYFNDDVLLGRPVWPEDFLAPGGGYNVFLAWRVPDCAAGCSAGWLQDGHCEAACNTASCDWDGGDCAGASPELRHSAAAGHDAAEFVEADADADLDAHGDPFAAGDASDGCAPGCEDSWLGDRFCDVVCNVSACAHDLGDCGAAVFAALPDLGPLRDGAEYVLPPGARAAYWNVSALAATVRLAAVSFPPRRAVRGLVLSQRLDVVTVLLRENVPLGRLPVFVTGTALGRNETDSERLIGFHVVSGEEVDAPGDLTEEVARLGRLVEKEDVWDAELERRLRAAERRLPDRSVYLRRRVELLQRAAAAGNATVDRATAGLVPAGNFSAGQIPSRRLLGARPILLHPASDSQLVDLEPGSGTHRPLDDHHSRNDFTAARLRDDLTGPGPEGQLDTYGASLLYVNRLYTRRYGPQQRRAVAHMPHLLSRAVIADMQAALADEFARTSAARVRTPDDMQFAFAYFYYLMSERDRVPASAIFDELDTDGSGTWSDREIRTLMTRLWPLPLTLADLEQTWTLLRRCAGRAPIEPTLSTPAGERYLDSDLPTVSRAAVLACPELVTQLERAMGQRQRYPYHVLDADDVAFTMVRANVSRLVGALDSVRRAPRKFLCLNNNVGAGPEDEVRLVYALLVDFLEALFPQPSQFELPANFRNRFQHVRELREWERQRGWLRGATVLLTLLLLLSLLHVPLPGTLGALCPRRRRPRRLAQQV